MPDPLLSIVLPCYNEEALITEVHRRVSAAAQSVTNSYEIVFVNDGSRDMTFEGLVALSAGDPHLVIIQLSRNFGHQMALSAGFAYCRGQRVLAIDADLQDPPELLPEMMRVMDDEHADVVYGQRIQRKGESWFKRTTAALFYRLLRLMTDVAIPVDTGDFRLMRRQVVNALNLMPEQHRFLRGMSTWVGFRQVAFPYQRAARGAGTTKFSFAKMLRFAVDAMTSFSMRPLRVSFYLASTMALLALVLVGLVVYSYFMNLTVPGWASLLALFLIFGSAQLVVLGIIGEYVGRIYMEVKRRPLFLVSEVVRSGRIVSEDERHAYAVSGFTS